MAGEPDLHSTGRPELPLEELPIAIQKGLEELRLAFPGSNVRCRSWNPNYVAVALNVPVDLPSRGPVDDIDIRPTEPVILLFHKTRFPRKPPIVYSDRKDFPTARLPHLNPTSPGMPASLCLHRGSLDDWFAEHSLPDLVGRVRAWLRDAAASRLIRQEDRFEGTRISDPIGIVIYPPADLIEAVEKCWNESGGQAGNCFLMVTFLKNEVAKEHYPSRLSYRVDFPLPGPPTGKLVDLFGKYNRAMGERPQEDKLLFGLLVWSPQAPLAEYFGSLPSSYGELKDFCKRLGIELEDAVADYRDIGAQLLGGVPIIVALLRSQPLIGSNSPVELLHFSVLASDEHCEDDGRWKEDAPVLVLSHRTPLTVAFASEMSREDVPDPSSFALVGCGAVGSKLSLHLARAGHVSQTLIDEADLSPHHLVRHGLAPEYVGKNKAEALKEYIISTYRLDQGSLNIRAYPRSIYDLLERPEELAGIPYLVDATASSAVLSALVAEDGLPGGVHYSRCEIADEGRLGLLFWEGQERNPRVDDLQALLFNFGQHVPAVTRWLVAHQRERQEERAAALEEIGIGMSCSSTTLRLADDVVSFHASLFSAAYKERELWARENAGKIQISLLSVEDAVSTSTNTVVVPPVIVLAANGRADWQVRVQAQVQQKVSVWTKKAGRKETGGLLLGLAHKKRKIIYVTDVLPPSRDSKGTPYAFKRGVKDYPEILDAIEARTGGLIGYVGEWHTHPDGLASLSDPDLRAVKEIRAHLDLAGLPTHIMVFADDQIASFVFTPDA